jgi:quinol monooxygenase YgiN
MATLLAHLRVHPGREPEFEWVAAELWRQTHANESRVRRYEYWRGAQPSTYYTLESFDDFHGFLSHQASAHHEAAAPRLREMLADVRLEWVDPVGDASGLAATAMQPLRPGAHALEVAYHERYPAEVQDWWIPLRTGAGNARG